MDITILEDREIDIDKKYGIDGQYFEITLNKRLNKHDVIFCKEHPAPLIIVDEDTTWVIHHTNDSIKEYWIHSVALFDPEPYRFFPGKFLKAGTVFNLITT